MVPLMVYILYHRLIEFSHQADGVGRLVGKRSKLGVELRLRISPPLSLDEKRRRPSSLCLRRPVGGLSQSSPATIKRLYNYKKSGTAIKSKLFMNENRIGNLEKA